MNLGYCFIHNLRFDDDCPKCEIRRQEQSDEKDERIAKLEAALKEYADPKNWESAGSFMGEASAVMLWSGWNYGKGNGPEIAKEALEEK